MKKTFSLDPADRELFRSTVGPVKRIAHDRVALPRTNIVPIPRSRLDDEQQVLKDMFSDYFDPAEIDTGEEIYYCRPGLQHTVLRKLRRGHFREGATLDLHGMSVAAARQALGGFLQTARQQDITCVRIIHGKGNRSRHKGPVIKQKVNHWLRQRDEVLAFCSARPMDGGTGAIYLLLRRRA